MLKKIIFYCMLFAGCQISHASIKNILFGEIYNRDLYTETNTIITNHSDDTWTSNNKNINGKFLTYFSRAICTDDNCIALGMHEISGTPLSRRPVILSSQDNGTTWSPIHHIKGIDTKLNYLEGSFNHLVCYEKRCYLSGMIKNVTADDKSYSLIISEDGGSSWAIPAQDNSVATLDFYCINSQCLSRGEKDGTFVISEPNGQTQKVITLDLPDARKIQITHLQPSGNNYIAMGYVTQSNNHKPITLISNDGGEHWQEKNHDKISVDNLTCHNESCLASSNDFYPDSKYPMLMLSRDSGETWNLLSVSSKTPPNNALSMTIYKSVCTDKACTIIGTQHLSRGSKPLIATVNISDKDNVYQVISNKFDPDLELADILCNQYNCYIAGHKPDLRHWAVAPVILESDLSMSQWKDISDRDFQPALKSKYRIRAMAVGNH